MCGLVGIVDFRDDRVDAGVIRRMCSLVAHRGPNHEGVWAGAGAGLGHRRLAITDLVTGQQPLGNEDQTILVVFNGEIYNYRELRRLLEARGHRFRTQTDTEVIPHLYEEHGDEFVALMEGVWAIALWDSRRRRLLLTRDRVGEKPLVWSLHRRVLRFGSEAKALFADPALPRRTDPRGLEDVLAFGYTTEEHTMFEGVRTVLPGTLLAFEEGRLTTEERYWDVADVAPYRGTVEQAATDFCDLFSEVVRTRLIGDVPYGLMLSGGIDSPLVGSFLAEHDPALRAATISRGDGEDESARAALVAEAIGLEHHVIRLAGADAGAIAARIPWMFDQPFFNDATIANYLFAQTLAGDLTVAITGDGADHAFSGTIRHVGDGIAGALARAPRPLVAAGAAATGLAIRVGGDRQPLRRAGALLRASGLDERRRWLALHRENLPARHQHLLLNGRSPRNGYDPDAAALGYYDRCSSPDHLNKMLYAELRFQLPPNDLLKVDRTFMWNGVAGRSPFLDRRVIEFAASLPSAWKRHGGQAKWFLRKVARRRLPGELAAGRKIGLAVPLRGWLKGDLGDRVAALLRSPSFAQRGIFSQQGALQALADHRAGRVDYGYSLWTMAMTEVWFRCQIDTFAEPDERIWE